MNIDDLRYILYGAGILGATFGIIASIIRIRESKYKIKEAKFKLMEGNSDRDSGNHVKASAPQKNSIEAVNLRPSSKELKKLAKQEYKEAKKMVKN